MKKKFLVELRETTTTTRTVEFIFTADDGEDLYNKIEDLVIDEGKVIDTNFVSDVMIDKTEDLTQKIIKETKREILKQIEDGLFTAEDIKSFSDLHDYCDANCYAGVCDDDSPWSVAEDTDLLNQWQDAVDKWIKEGGLR